MPFIYLFWIDYINNKMLSGKILRVSLFGVITQNKRNANVRNNYE